MKSQDDNRLQFLYVHQTKEGLKYKASFNIYPYNSIEISIKQYKRYKQICTPKFQCCIGTLVEFWACDPLNNGLPKWFNKLF